MNEFENIEHYFKPKLLNNQHVPTLGISDDAAVISIGEGEELVVSMDTLVEGVHFLRDTSPRDIASKSVLVNLSDMAAMGAAPRWITLSLTLPENNIDWIKEFSSQFNNLAAKYSLSLIGGDLTKGPLSITIQMHGTVPKGRFLCRSGAKPGDLIYVTGELGAAAYTLKYFLNPDKNIEPTKEEIKKLNDYLEGRNYSLSDISLDISSAPKFYNNVWEVCRSIPIGKTRSYKWVAEESGSPKAARAVGQAMANNKITLIIPCHRVVGADGTLTGFGQGKTRFDLKLDLLKLEADYFLEH